VTSGEFFSRSFAASIERESVRQNMPAIFKPRIDYVLPVLSGKVCFRLFIILWRGLNHECDKITTATIILNL
jgi:hypothetical protein